MRCIFNPCTSPPFNLAAEEWLLRHSGENVFMLWRNAPAVIVGRHQNTAAEVDEDFLRRRDIALLRRITGGGAVFHDLGNVNFSFIHLGHSGRLMDFRRFTAPILEALRAIGVDCSFDGRNDLVTGGKKFSGNAQHLERDRLLHHGTLLFSSSLEDLTGALRASPEKFRDKAVKSLPARIAMLKNSLPDLDAETFMRLLMTRMIAILNGTRCNLKKEEEIAIEELARRKYSSWDWNFGVSPAYGFTRRTGTPAGVLDVQLDIQSGIINAACIRGDFFALRPVEELETLVHDCRHERTALTRRLANINLEEYIQGLDVQCFVDCLL